MATHEYRFPVVSGSGLGDMLTTTYDPDLDGVVVGADAVTGLSLSGGGTLSNTAITETKYKVTMLNNGTIALTTGKAGWCHVQVGNNEERAEFDFAADGTLNSELFSDNISFVKDTASSFNIYKEGGGVVFQNKLGADKKVAYEVKYYDPT